MNGAIAVPSVKTINVPNNSKKKTIGANQNTLFLSSVIFFIKIIIELKTLYQI